MDQPRRKPPSPFSMENLLENNPREAKYFKPGETRPELVWERLWTTTNRDYGDTYFTENRPALQSTPRRVRSHPEQMRGTTPEEQNFNDKPVDRNLEADIGFFPEKESDPEICRNLAGEEEDKRNYFQPDHWVPESPVLQQECMEAEPRPGTRPIDKEFIMSGLGKAYLQHSVGRYWDSMRVPSLKF